MGVGAPKEEGGGRGGTKEGEVETEEALVEGEEEVEPELGLGEETIFLADLVDKGELQGEGFIDVSLVHEGKEGLPASENGVVEGW